MNNDVHRALGLSILAILQATQAAKERLSPEQYQKLNAALQDNTAKLALVVTTDGLHAHCELALIDAQSKSPFKDQALLRMDGPVMAAATVPGTIPVTDRATYN